MIGTGLALLGSAIIGGGAALGAGYLQKKSADNGLALQKQMYDQSRADTEPFRRVGQGALVSLGQLYGIDKDGNQTGQPFNPDAVKAFESSPDYKFAFDQGMKGLTFSNAAKGMLKSGGAMKDIVQFGQGLATQNFGSYVNRLLQMSQIGAGAAAGNQNAALMASGQMSSSINQSGAAGASGLVGAANAASGALGTYGNQLYLGNLLTQMRTPTAPGAGAGFPVGGSTPVPYLGTAGGLPGYADGGYAPGERDIVVGEEGPEIVRLPPGGGEVIPNGLAAHAISTGMIQPPPDNLPSLQDPRPPAMRSFAALRDLVANMGGAIKRAAVGDPNNTRTVAVDENGVPTRLDLDPRQYEAEYGHEHPAVGFGRDLGMMAVPAVAAKPVMTGLEIAGELLHAAPKTATAFGVGGLTSALTDTASEGADKARPSQQHQVLVDGLKDRMDRNDVAIQRLRDQIATNDANIAKAGQEVTKSAKGTQLNSQNSLTSSNSGLQRQLDTLLADQRDLTDRHGKASDDLAKMIDAEHNEDRQAESEGRSTVDKQPWTKALPYVGGAAALALSWGTRYRAIAAHNEYVDRIVEATKKAENAIKKNPFSSMSSKRVEELKNLESGYETVANDAKTKLAPLLGNAVAGGLVATELGMAPYQMDRNMPEGTAGRTKAETMTDFTSPEMWKQAGWSALPGATGASVGAEVSNFLNGKHLPDLERANAVITNYADTMSMDRKEWREREAASAKNPPKRLSARPTLRLLPGPGR